MAIGAPLTKLKTSDTGQSVSIEKKVYIGSSGCVYLDSANIASSNACQFALYDDSSPIRTGGAPTPYTAATITHIKGTIWLVRKGGQFTIQSNTGGSGSFVKSTSASAGQTFVVDQDVFIVISGSVKINPVLAMFQLELTYTV